LSSSEAAAPPAPIRQRIPVAFEYAIHFTRGVLDPDNPLLASVLRGAAKPARAVAVLDAGLVARLPDLPARLVAYACRHAAAMELRAPPLVVPGGEAAKNDPALWQRVQAAMDAGGICRHSYLLAFGGGAVLDMAGFAAATAHRGVRLVRLPSTALAQDDSGVGVKCGVNAFGKKNFLGAFAPPFAVINDLSFLALLDERDWRSGLAEAVKVALIRDAAFFAALESDVDRLAARDMAAMERAVHRSAALHAEHIATCGDPFEMGSSRPLDFGHWAAHRLEHLSGYRLRHGEAVAIGVALDATYSYLRGLLPRPEWERILALLGRLGFALDALELHEQAQDPEHPRSLFRGLAEFREHLGGELTIMLLAGIGRGEEVHEVELGLYRQALGLLRERGGPRALVA
jgi:3-dehydroquinate synthase